METLRYYAQRLLPFFLAYFAYEAMEIGILAGLGSGSEPCNTASLLALLNETVVSFLFSILPYLLYLLALPQDFHGSRSDKSVTLALFSLYCLANAAEELAEVLSGDSFDLFARCLLQRPGQALGELARMPGFPQGALLALAIVLASSLLFRRRLMPATAAPKAPARLLAAFLPTLAALILGQAQNSLEPAQAASGLYSDGLVSLFGGIFAFTAIPNLARIYAPPCEWLAGGMLLLLLLKTLRTCLLGKNAALPAQQGQLFPGTGKGVFRMQLICMLSTVLLLRLASLGLYPLMDTTEARYGEMARKMLETGNWLQPQFDYGIPFWGKPPLSFQASALAMQLFGANAFAARLAPFAATIGIGLLFYCWPFAKQRTEQATTAFIILLTSAIGFVAAGAVMTDAFLTLGAMLAMVSFRQAVSAPDSPRRWGYLFFVGLAIGMLAKGPVILILCGGPIILWALLCRRWSDLRSRIPWGKGALLLLLLALPWYIAAERTTPGFLRYFIIGEHFERFVIKGWQGDLYGSGHARALGTIWLYAAEMFLPWTLLAPFLLRRTRRPRQPQQRQNDARCYLWLWGLFPLLFFTAARNILPAYVLPGIPAFCILLTDALWTRAETRSAIRQFIFMPAPILMLATLFALGGGFSRIEYRCDHDMLRAWDGASPLYYAANKATYSGQFYSAGKARALSPGQPPSTLSPGSFLAVPRASDLSAQLSASPDWRLVSSNRKWNLFHKQ